MTPMIAVRGLGKQYRLRGRRAAYATLRESIMGSLARRGSAAQADRVFWALRDVSVDVAPGEVVGVIGRNGAGKSTLLKVLSRITEPSEGEVDLYGRAGCLLEVGTGFHGELSGRDNIYLSGAVLGMKRREIARKFDSIVAFAEVAAFLDTPIKHYSSGMTMRLAFSVAAHLDPEILIIDEVLAVGDAAFQRKCMGKMEDAARQGRTILFVSHNMAAVRSLCRRVLVLEGGRVVMDGEVDAGINRYLGAASGSGANQVDVSTVDRPNGHGGLLFERIALATATDRAVTAAGGGLDLEIDVRVETAVNDVEFSIAIDTPEGVRLSECASSVALGRIARLEPGAYRLRCGIAGHLLNPGCYLLSMIARSGSRVIDDVLRAMPFEVEWQRAGAPAGREDLQGLVRLDSAWSAPEPIGD
jgi:lipopolysaccharide transport system ATP-binding protein